MKRYKIVIEKTSRNELITVICDFCKQEIDKSFVECGGFGQIKIEFGYPSNYDGDVYEGEICDSCFKKLFKDKLKLIWNYVTGERNESIH